MMRAKEAEPARPSDFMPFTPKQTEPESEPDPVAYFTAVATGKS